VNLALAAVAAICGFIIGYWVPGAFLPERLEWVAGAAVGLLAGLGVWSGQRSRSPAVRGAVAGAAWGGIIGFVGGFFGPMLVGGGNQGPMLGLFITGPGGVILGAVAGAIRALRRSGD
jgi:hypothetical protein